jgi:murein DD-endopeptidase MepM/ murein hydrolase activator NlpD
MHQKTISAGSLVLVLLGVLCAVQLTGVPGWAPASSTALSARGGPAQKARHGQRSERRTHGGHHKRHKHRHRPHGQPPVFGNPVVPPLAGTGDPEASPTGHPPIEPAPSPREQEAPPAVGGGAALAAPWPAGVRFQAGNPCGSWYGQSAHRNYGGQWGDDAWSVDFGVCGSGDFGTPVLAPLDGVVRISNFNSAYGNQVLIEAGNGLAVRLAHLDQRTVSAGQTVTVGDQVGTLGHSGSGGGDFNNSHLHVAAYAGRGVNAGIAPTPMAGVELCNGCWVTSATRKAPPAPPPADVRWVAQSEPGIITPTSNGVDAHYSMTLVNRSSFDMPLSQWHLGVAGDEAIKYASSPSVIGGRNRVACADGNHDDGVVGQGEQIVCSWDIHVPADAPGEFKRIYFDWVQDGGPYGHTNAQWGWYVRLNVQSADRWPAQYTAADCDRYTLVGQQASPFDSQTGHAIVSDGKPATAKWTIRNDNAETGCVFYKGGSHPFRLGVVSPQRDAASPFYTPADSGWASANRLQLDDDIRPGGSGTVTFKVTKPGGMPSNPDARLYVDPVVEGKFWLHSIGQYLPIAVRDSDQFPDPPPNAPEWDAKYVERITPALVSPGSTGKFVFTVENRGWRSWTSSVHLGTSSPQDASVRWAAEGVVGTNRVAFTDENGDGKVSYGEKARFEYWIRPPSGAAGAFRQGWALVNDAGGPWFFQSAAMYAPVVVASPTNWPPELRPADCTWALASQDPPATVSDGQTARFTWVLRNSSELCPWFRDGGHPFRLGTDNPRDGASPFYTAPDPAWIGPGRNRLGLAEDAVAPGGQTGTFKFTLSKPAGMAPTEDARLYATPLIEGWSWLSSISMYAPVRVR